MLSSLYCIGLVSLSPEEVYKQYLTQYAEFLLKKGKKVVLISPHFHSIRQIIANKNVRWLESLSGSFVESLTENKSVLETISLWKHFANLLKEAAKTLNTTPDLVFFCPIEPFNRDKINITLLDLVFPYRWSGLISRTLPYHQNELSLNKDPGFLEKDYIFRSQNCVGVCLYDRFAFEAVRSRVYKKVVLMPEQNVEPINNTTSPTPGMQILQKARQGRTIVGLIGEEAQHGFSSFLQLIELADPEKYLFVYCGPDLLEVPDQLPLNLLFYPYPSQETELNQLYSLIDIAWQYFYTNDVSCRMLNKASHFNKPVIANKDQLIGRYVKKFKLGVAVNGKMNERLQALEFLNLSVPAENLFDENNFKEYNNLHSSDSLEIAFEQLAIF